MTPIDQNEGGRPKDEILAGEYVLGVLSADARRMVERRIAEDRAFATLVERWQSDLSTFNDDYQETPPSAAVFAEIEKRLFGGNPSPVATGLWNAAGFWRWVSLATSAVAVVALVYASGMLSMQPSRASRMARWWPNSLLPTIRSICSLPSMRQVADCESFRSRPENKTKSRCSSGWCREVATRVRWACFSRMPTANS